MPTRIEFLRHVLPSEGWYCSVTQAVKPTGEAYMHQRFHDSIEDLAARFDETNGQGVNAWFACASFRKRGSRKGSNVLKVKSFWLDIDVEAGNPKKYANVHEAAADIIRVWTLFDWPRPTLLQSGYGLHVWLTLDEDMTPEQWLMTAAPFKKVCLDAGLRIDKTRTADIASVMRAPD